MTSTSFRHRCALVATAVMAMAAGVAHEASAQAIYRSIDADGRVVFSDRPPAATGTAPAGTARTASSPGNELSYALRQAQARYPVALYTASDCSPCGSARALLVTRGVPFTEYTVQSDADEQALRALSGQNQLPFATIGRQHLAGFADDEWRQYLDAAGYPTTSELPANYRRAAPSPLVAQVPAQPKTTAPARSPAAAVPAVPASRVSPSNPAGLSF